MTYLFSSKIGEINISANGGTGKRDRETGRERGMGYQNGYTSRPFSWEIDERESGRTCVVCSYESVASQPSDVVPSLIFEDICLLRYLKLERMGNQLDPAEPIISGAYFPSQPNR